MPLPSRIYLVEDFNANLRYDDGSVVSLTPDASYQLGSRGIPYKILTDYVSEKKLREGEEQFLYDQLQWISRFDLLIKKHVLFCGTHGIDFMRMSFHQLKYFIDSVIIQARTLRFFLQVFEGPILLIYVRNEKAEAVSIQSFSRESYSALYPLFLPQLCKEDAQWNFELVEKRKAQEPSRKSLKDSIKKIPVVQRVTDLIKWVSLSVKFGIERRRFYGASSAKIFLNIFFIHFGSKHLDFPILQLCRARHNIFLRYREMILTPGQKLTDSGKSLSQKGLDQIDQIHKDLKVFSEIELAQSPEGCELTGWVTQQCGLDVSLFILGALQTFLVKSGGDTLALSVRYHEFYLYNKIDYVISHTKTDLFAMAAFIAAGLSGVKKVVVQHGCQLFHDDLWNLTDFDLTDVYFCADPLSQDLFTNGLRAIGLKGEIQIYQSAHCLKQFVGKSGDETAKKAKEILYLPTKLRTHAKRFNLSSYPATWYFEYQKSLIDYFGINLAHCRVTYKQAIVNRKYADDALVAYLDKKKYRNIKIDSRSTLDCIGTADAIVTDRPTTVFFEAIAAKKPILALYPDFAEDLIEPKAKELFGKSLVAFSGVEEALGKIEEMFSDSLVPYRHEIKLGDTDISSTLCRINMEGTRVKTMNTFELYLQRPPHEKQLV